MSLVARLSPQFSICELCQVFGLERSSYYQMRRRQQSRNVRRDRLRARLVTLHADSRGSAGARTLAKLLCSEGHAVGRYKAARLMREAGIRSTQQRKHRYRVAEEESVIAPNLLQRRFNVEQPNQVWCGDVTYIWGGNRWIYLAAVLDLYARRLVGWAIGDKPDSDLTCRALNIAFESRGRPTGLMFHSDQGCHYTSRKFRQTLEQHGITQSMSRRGNCWDNAPMERFFRSLKTEWIPAEGYSNPEAAKADVLRYLTGYYNQRRLHSSNGYRTPVAMEALAA